MEVIGEKVIGKGTHGVVTARGADECVKIMRGPADQMVRETTGLRLCAGVLGVVPLLGAKFTVSAGGICLETRMPLGQPLQGRYDPEHEGRAVAFRVLCALAGMHERGVAHRDIKPDNMVEMLGGVAVIDLSCAIVVWQRGDPEPTHTPGQTTAMYRSPEQYAHAADGRAIDPRAGDVWAAGVALGELLGDGTGDLWGAGNALVNPLGDSPAGAADAPAVAALAEAWSADPGAAFGVRHEGARDLLRLLLVVDPAARATAREALAHPYFAGLAAPAVPPPPALARVPLSVALEKQTKAKTKTKVNKNSWRIVVAWLARVHVVADLSPATLSLACEMLKRVLCDRPVELTALQRVACAATLLASAAHEVHPIMAADLVYLSDNTFTEQALLKEAARVYEGLDYCVWAPSRATEAWAAGLADYVSFDSKDFVLEHVFEIPAQEAAAAIADGSIQPRDDLLWLLERCR